MKETYIDVEWRHTFHAEPVRLLSELDADRFETRKIEFFRNGRVGFADALEHTQGTELGTVSVPALADINLDTQFHGKALSKEAFEIAWLRATKQNTQPGSGLPIQQSGTYSEHKSSKMTVLQT